MDSLQAMNHVHNFLRYACVILIAVVGNMALPRAVFAQEQRVLFINQVRGEECCDAGSLDHVQQQVDAFAQSDLPATFVVRYDALQNPRYTALLKSLPAEQFEVGGLLEVTPQLARDSGVEYRGKVEDWYQAQQVFVIGYEQADRQKILSTYMSRFKEVFGEFPRVTTAWMTDTDSLNYLHEEYGVQVHQITREQWGLDSYTMSGGPFHYPYISHPQWAFMPASATEQGILIVRQTGSDPVHVYGDTTSAFTTQPNDYTIDGKDFGYFERLSQILLSQPHNKYGFLLLGLENSMAGEFQKMYGEQIKKVAQWQTENDDLRAVLASSFNDEYREKWREEVVNAVVATDPLQDASKKALWINAPGYRLRLIINGTRVQITDWRVYGDKLSDPYNEMVAQRAGFWVAPYVFQASRLYEDDTAQFSNTQRFWRSLQTAVLPEYQNVNREPLSSKNDFDVNAVSLELPEMKNETYRVERSSPQELTLTYETTRGVSTKVKFMEDQVHISVPDGHFNSELLDVSATHNPFLETKKTGASSWQLMWQGHTPLENGLFGLEVACSVSDQKPKVQSCIFQPQFSPEFSWSSFLKDFYPFVFPEVRQRDLDQEKTVIYAHNPHAIWGENPARIVVIPKDERGFSITTQLPVTVTSKPELKQTLIREQGLTTGVVFIDTYASTPGKYAVTVQLSPEVSKEVTVYFAANCRENKLYCVRHPRQAWWFVQSWWYAKLRDQK